MTNKICTDCGYISQKENEIGPYQTVDDVAMLCESCATAWGLTFCQECQQYLTEDQFTASDEYCDGCLGAYGAGQLR